MNGMYIKCNVGMLYKLLSPVIGLL